MSAPDVAAFAARTAELERHAADLAVAEQAMIDALAAVADAEARLRKALPAHGNETSSLAEMEQAVGRVD